MVGTYVTDETIEDAIDRAPGEVMVTEVRDILSKIQDSVEEHWTEWMDMIEDGNAEVVADTGELVVLDTGESNQIDVELDHHPLISDDVDHPALKDVLTRIMHEIASEHTDHDWGGSYPMVLRKPDGASDGERYAEAIVNGLMRRGLSPGQAWAYYGVEIRGNSRNAWATRCGYSDHSAVSEAVRKAEAKLP